MKWTELHGWQVDRAQALALQRRLAGQVVTSGDLTVAELIAGVDISSPGRDGVAAGAVVVLKYPELIVVDVALARGKLGFPYIPGLLSFRESPLILAAAERLAVTPDLILVDGQGLAHPRRLGLASHLGLLWNRPTIGCAKSLLCGECGLPGNEPGEYAVIRDGGEIIGVALRTKSGNSPVYVSIGHKIDLEAAQRWVLNCCRGYRLPEPTRLAHLAAGGNLKLVGNLKQARLV